VKGAGGRAWNLRVWGGGERGEGRIKGVGCGLDGIVATTSTKPAAFRECSSAWGA